MTYNIWKTVTIKKLTQKQLKKKGIQLSDYAADLLSKIEWKEKGKVHLVRTTVQELFGDNEWHTTKQIYAKAREKGLELCPAEAVPALRLEYKDQPIGEWLIVGMEPIADPDGYSDVFYVVRRADGLWLDSGWASPTDGWYPANEFVFRLRKSFDSLTLDPLNLDGKVIDIEGQRYKLTKINK